MPLSIYTSNRMENLVEALAEVVASPLPSPFTPEIILVQSRGMQRWLAMELAGRFGVWANCVYPFPNSFIDDLFARVLQKSAEEAPYVPTVLAWRIMETLPGLLEQDAFASLKGYLAGGSQELKLYQLACRLADVFDQYTLFRGEMLEGWENGREDHWQAVLWRAIVAIAGNGHRWNFGKRFFREFEGWFRSGGELPVRVAVLGISWLPKFHLDVLAAVSQFTEVNLFIMSPCREYWADILPARRRARLPKAIRALSPEGNPLLASLGRLGKEFSEIIAEYGATGGGESDLYREAEGGTLLTTLQNDILGLKEIGEGAEKICVMPNDRSLRVHSCHGPMREVEILHDSLLAMFDEMKDLSPRHILVMTPDIEKYAPYVSAVFEGSPDHSVRIPFSIADRNICGEGRLSRPLLAMFHLPGKRFPVTGVMDILAAGPVHVRFGLEEDDLDLARSWLEETRIRWGLDSGEREREGFPPYRENSWRAGLDRLLLGYAMPEETGLFLGVLPYDDMEGEAVETLGKFSCFVEKLHGLVEDLDRPRTLPEWGHLCRGILEGFFAPADDDADELAMIDGILDGLDALPLQSGYAGTVGLQVFRSWLAAGIGKQGRGLGFLSGGVTFCAMLPMRSIPFRVIALLGMNDGAFPRQERPLGFDLAAMARKPGDRSLRDEDRYLFLEVLLSARERLHISYTGQSMRDNAILPPSVLVDELLDYLGNRFTDGSREFHANLVARHPLQPFSPACFSGETGLSSYSEENYRAVLRRAGGVRPQASFFPGPLPEPPDEMREVSVENLLDFFDNPARYLLITRLGIRFDRLSPSLEDREPFEIDSLDSYLVRREMLEMLLKGKTPDECRELVKARGVLPPASQGEMLFEEIAAEAGGLAGRINELTGGRSRLESYQVDIEIDGFRIVGRIEGIWPDRLIRYRCGKCSGRDRIRLWIEHLILASSALDRYPGESVLVTLDQEVRIKPVTDSLPILRTLLGYFRQGLCRPLKFFPRSSFAFSVKGEISHARTAWCGDHFPENDNPYYDICFAGSDPLDGEFEEVALAILDPLLAHQVKCS
ncbi:MAG: exodeoxyribonuclease V subunit gamma [Geobacteraceae bacterium]|nr:exodeoxyribonuclease V subunit gamma [Geobacteraceae bacterium]